MNITITLEEYEALSSLARKRATVEELRQISAFLANIEKTNGVTRSFLWVLWQEADAPLPAGSSFPTKWPPECKVSVERTDRAIARADVDAILARKARKPVSIMVTTDPGAELGWQKIEDYFRG